MTGFALFDTAIGWCGIAWGPRGIVGVMEFFSHDAREPVQFVFSDGASRLGVVTDHPLDELAHPIAQAGFDRIKPIVEKMNRRLGLRLQGCRVRAIAGHGVVSTGAQNAGIVWVSAPGDYATFNSNQPRDATGP